MQNNSKHARILGKVCTVLTASVLTFTTTAPAAALAIDEIQDSLTTEANVSFDAKIAGAYEAQANLGEMLDLGLSLKVENTGYVKDVNVSLEGENYKVADGESLELEEANAGEEKTSSVKISLPKQEKVSKEAFTGNNKVKLDATYVNAEGNEKKIEKELQTHVNWISNPEIEAEFSLARFLNYQDGGKTKTMVTFKVKDGVKDNLVPLEKKELELILPKIDEKDPEKIIVLGSENYEVENGILKVRIENKPDENGLYAWDSQTETEVTLIYDAAKEEKTFETGLEVKANTLDGKEIKTSFEKETFELEQDVGSIVEVTSKDANIAKGMLYANLAREEKYKTEYTEKYDLRIGYAEIVDSIVFSETEEHDLIKNQKITINPDNLKFILGEDGYVNVKDYQGNILGTITKSRTELLVNDNKLFTFETSKPKTEGILTINVNKELNQAALNTFDEEDIDDLDTLGTKTKLVVIKDNAELSSVENEKVLTFEDATSNAAMTISTKTLSTQSVNEDVVFNVVLKTNDASDRLYKNPNVKITLPEDVTSINVKQAQILYTEELKPADIEISNNEILLKLEGTQTEYTKSATSVGPVLRVVADVSLNNLIPSKDEKVIVTYTNENTDDRKELVEDIRIVAPEGFITTNTISVNGIEETSLTDNRQIEVSKSGNSRITLSQLIVNNEEDVSGLSIVGRIPSAGNKTLEGVELGSNVDTELIGRVTVEGLDADVLYSTNANEEVDGNWTEDRENAKSYKIVAKDVVPQGTIINTSYEVELPDSLDSGAIARSIYGVYYNNNAELGTPSSLAQAQAVGVYTEETPDLSLEVVAYDTHDGHTIGSNQEVKTGEYITYVAAITNNGDKAVDNVNVVYKADETVKMVIEIKASQMITPYNYFDEIRAGHVDEVNREIGTLNPGEKKYVKYDTYVELTDKTEITNGFSLTANKLAGTVEREISNPVAEGPVSVTLAGNLKTEDIKPGNTFGLQLIVLNTTSEEINNVEAKIVLPKELTSTDENYNKNTKTYSKIIEKMDPYAAEEIIIPVAVTEDATNGIKLQATARVGEIEVKSNTLEYVYVNLNTQLDVTHSVSFKGNEIEDTDEYTETITIKNNTGIEQTFTMEQRIPGSAILKKHKVVIDGEKKKETEPDYIDERFTLPAGSTAIITNEFASAQYVKGTTREVLLQPIIKNEDKKTVPIEKIRFKVIGTGVSEAGQNKTSFLISGEVFIDDNDDGKKTSDEERLKGIKLTLYSGNTIAKGETGDDLVTTSGDNGTYTFKRVLPGEYIIVAEYNNKEYTVGNYKVSGLSSNEDIDFVLATLNGKEVAATNNIQLTNTNLYNIDLGLTKKNNFDLKLTQKVKKVTITNPNNETRVYDFDSDIVKVELSNKNLDGNTITIDYELVVTNKGKISGYVKKIMNTMPAGFDIPLNLNDGWYVKAGKAFNEALANTEIKPGESKTIPLTLIYKANGENIGTFRNTAEIVETFNAQGLDNKKESNTASSAVTFMIASGLEAVAITGIVLAILIITAGGIVVIKKYVVKK